MKQFPEFTSLTIEHQHAIKHITSQYEPYSDFNFTSLFCWNTDDTTEVAILNNNLVIKLPDYITGEPVFSVLGKSDIDSTLRSLLALSPHLKLVPEVVVANISSIPAFNIKEDPDNFDYVYKLSDLATLKGQNYKKKRNKANRFATEMAGNIGFTTEKLDKLRHREAVKQLFYKWAKSLQKGETDIAAEGKAIDRLLENAQSLDVLISLLKVRGNLVAFSINEVLNKRFAISHFEKALLIHNDIYPFLVKNVAEALFKRGCEYVNWEQDLGIAGLKNSKTTYQPSHFLKKYQVSVTSGTE